MDNNLCIRYDEEIELIELCHRIKELADNGDFSECRKEICESMCQFPSSAEPHNLMGVILEMTNNHIMAMRHFRVALDLNPTYKYAQINLMSGTLKSRKNFNWFFGIEPLKE